MVGIALLGAGIFAKTAHLPAIQACPTLDLKAIYSRSQKSAEDVASAAVSNSDSKSKPKPDVYFDALTPEAEDRSLDALLAREDIVGVIIALPILSQPEVIRKAIEAGKHVLSEKPVAGDLDTAGGLVRWYDALPGQGGGGEGGKGKPFWGVAENFRYIDALEYAAREIEGMIKSGGRLSTFRLARYGWVAPGDKYLNTSWRKVPQYQGGFLLDGGVHFVAALRMMLAAAGEEVGKLVGFSGLLEERLGPVDTVNAVAVTKGGKSGSITMSFGTEFKNGLELEVVTTQGAVRFVESWPKRSVTSVRKNDKGEKVEEKKEFEFSIGVADEVAAWVVAMEKGVIEERQSPAEAMKDLEILQRLLESGEKGGEVKTIG
ncbi:hypothetical protein QBC34DRAFT_488631 [Podospora aff. communis PSN243]|uniref:Oxidoreductase n=1 Tax=Podospora aff. communis PSN243 TaxID=3040156 RepID=A0AAV9G434_9PEZI|nr:hypothetical protein QBC34DRAFT_488631 [Podospora aff. communis PSN243]